MKEIWKDIPKYEGLYQVSNLGNIRNKKNNKLLKSSIHKGGYLRIGLFKNNKEIKYYIHTLVAMAFLNKNKFKSMPYENKILINNDELQVNHKDENPSNNITSNLEYCTRLYNCNYGTRKERISINNKQQKTVLQYDINNKFIKEWENGYKAEKELKIRHINEVCKNKRKTAGGYIWRFKEER